MKGNENNKLNCKIKLMLKCQIKMSVRNLKTILTNNM